MKRVRVYRPPEGLLRKFSRDSRGLPDTRVAYAFDVLVNRMPECTVRWLREADDPAHRKILQELQKCTRDRPIPLYRWAVHLCGRWSGARWRPWLEEMRTLLREWEAEGLVVITPLEGGYALPYTCKQLAMDNFIVPK